MTRKDPSRRRGNAVLATALASGATYAVAARQAGVSERTVKRRMTDPAFLAQVNEVHADTLQAGARKLAHLSGEAIDTMTDLMRANRPPNVRLGAARAVLETALRWQELAEMQRRLDNLELAHRTGRGS